MRNTILTGCGLALAVVVGLLGAARAQQPAATSDEIQVYRSPTCGCCMKWVEHLRDHGFAVTVTEVPNVAPLKQRVGLTPQLSSCHTGLVGDYVIEGHVPADAIERLLAEGPAVRGLSVPGMPIGSPGMEGPNGRAYNVYSFDDSGAVELYSTHEPRAR